MTVKCDVMRNEATSSHVHHSVEPHEIEVASHYRVLMAFYRDPDFTDVITNRPIDAKIGEDIYVKVYTAADFSVRMRVHTCYTKPSDDAPDKSIYYIIKDGWVDYTALRLFTAAALQCLIARYIQKYLLLILPC